MCFSATASFVTGGALCLAGFVAVKKSPDRTMLPFATIPLLFGVQQVTEGFLWQSMNECIPGEWTWPSALVFLIFAQVIWPVWVSFAMLVPEPNKKRRQFLSVLLAMGALLAVYNTYCLHHFPIAVNTGAHHINYQRDFPGRPVKLINTVYILATILPPFVSSIRRMQVLGSVLLLSFLVTVFFYRQYLISVWCFFAAIVSVMVLYVVHAHAYAQKEQQVAE